jgi:anaerobic ribonucleoside-triphosphate reductase activating protein
VSLLYEIGGCSLNYIKITPIDVANGVGCRVVLWTAGCEHHCKECHNPNTWNPNAGMLFDRNAEDKLFEVLSKPFISGLTLSGGDPLHPNNIDEITSLCKKIKEKLPQKTIWCYTGSVYEDIKDIELMKYLDVLVDGEFQIDNKDITLLFRGSSNQRLIDVPKTIKCNSVVLYN